METQETFSTLCDTVALVYHESRNVRHLVNRKMLDEDKWRFLVSLPTNRDDAWREIAPLRDKARSTGSVDAALRIFEDRFRVSLSQVAEMLANENWRHAKLYGGNAWAKIVRLTIGLADALNKGEPATAERLALQIKDAQHNTGSVNGKLAKLEKVRLQPEKGA